VLWAADVWYSIKKHWCLEAQRLVRAERNRVPTLNAEHQLPAQSAERVQAPARGPGRQASAREAGASEVSAESAGR
jgi:hypothetical protein